MEPETVDRAIEIETDVTWDDIRLLLDRRTPPASGFLGWLGDRWSWRWDLTVAGMMLAGTIFVLTIFPSWHALTLTAKTLAPIYVVIVLIGRTPLWRLFQGHFARAADVERHADRLHAYVGPRRVRIDRREVSVATEKGSESWAWASLELEAAAGVLYFHYDLARAVIVPSRCFGSKLAFDAFVQQATAFSQSALPVDDYAWPAEIEVAPTYDLQGNDLVAAWMADPPRWKFPIWSIPYFVGSAIPTIGMGAAAVMGDWRGWVVFPLILLSHAAVVFGGYVLELRRRRRGAHEAVERHPFPAALREIAVGVGQESILERTPVASHRVNWTAVQKYEVSMRTAVFHTGNGVVIVPSRVFDSQDAYFDFVERALELRRKALEGAA